MKKITLFTLLAINFFITGCSSIAANLERNLQDPAIWAQIQQISEETSASIQRGHTGPRGDPYEEIDLTGDWRRLDRSQVNSIRHTYEGIMVTPKGGRAVFYQQIGPNLFEDKGMTYEFDTVHTGVWRSNDKRNLVIRLRRASWD